MNEAEDHPVDDCKKCKNKGRLKFIKFDPPEENWDYDTEDI
jgi:hypothetical protein